MPADICFHISSAEAAKNDHGDATALTLPITPALHIPSTAQPTASLRSLCFTNTLANATASDGTSSCTLGLFSGSGHPQFTNGSAAPDPWIGLVYTDASGAAQTVVAPLIDPGGPWTYTGVSTTAAFHSFSVANLVDMITFTTRHTWADAKWLKGTGQIADATAAHAPHLPNSTVKGVLAMGIEYPTLSVSDSHLMVNINWTSPALSAEITKQNARIATTAEIRAKLTALGHSSGSTAVSMLHEYLGIANSTTSPVTTLFKQQVVVREQGTSTAGWELAPAEDLVVTIPDGAYSLEQIEAAVSRAALANATFRAAVEKEMAPTLLADPDVDGAWAGLGTHSITVAATDTEPAKTYRKLVGFEAALDVNRCRLIAAPNTRVASGALFTSLLGFDAADLGEQTVAQLTVTASHAARIDKDRSVVLHCPTLAAGSYSTKGERGGSALALVPVTVGIGDVESWEAKVPINVPCGIAGTALSSLHVYLLNEDGQPVNFLGDRWEAVICLSY